MFITQTEAYPVNPVLAPIGQTLVVEVNTERLNEADRMSVQRITGINTYQERGPTSTLHWQARCS